MDVKFLAQKFENKDFYMNSDGSARDPAFFMHQYLAPGFIQSDVEIAAFLSASLAFGQRQKILLAIQKILDSIKSENLTPVQWLKSGAFEKMFPDKKSGYYYRTFSNQNLHDFFATLKKIFDENKTMGQWLKNEAGALTGDYSGMTEKCLKIITASFDCSPLIPKNTESACKRICLFLRWMVRKSEVDIGFWDFIDRKSLIIPLDTHVIQSAKKMGILPDAASTNASMKNALKVTDAMKKIFPEDPCKADFALFGADVQ